MELMVSEHVADILAEKALDALSKLLRAVHIPLVHSPGAVQLRSAGLEGFDLFLGLEVP